MKSSPAGIIEKTESLSLADLERLATESDYILQITITAVLEAEYADFEGGETWIFDRYRVSIDKQIFPLQSDRDWMDDTLIMPGTTKRSPEAAKPQVGQSYIAFYRYSAMARGYSLEGLMHAPEEDAVEG